MSGLALLRERLLAILEFSLTLGVSAISKRKPPSRRAELKKDETAKAIARLREETSSGKPTESDRLATSATKLRTKFVGKTTGQQNMGGAIPPASTRRPKTFGS